MTENAPLHVGVRYNEYGTCSYTIGQGTGRYVSPLHFRTPVDALQAGRSDAAYETRR
jgi:hypothetical protein